MILYTNSRTISSFCYALCTIKVRFQGISCAFCTTFNPPNIVYHFHSTLYHLQSQHLSSIFLQSHLYFLSTSYKCHIESDFSSDHLFLDKLHMYNNAVVGLTSADIYQKPYPKDIKRIIVIQLFRVYFIAISCLNTSVHTRKKNTVSNRFITVASKMRNQLLRLSCCG